MFGALFQQADLRALILSLAAPDMERALSLARSSEAARARFHARYVVDVHAPAVEYFTVEQLEIITEFRRLELIGEDHARRTICSRGPAFATPKRLFASGEAPHLSWATPGFTPPPSMFVLPPWALR